MAIENYNNFRGNTVLVPEYNPSKLNKDKKYKELDIAKKQAQLKIKKKKETEKLKTLAMIALVFVMGIIIMYRYATVFKMEAELSKTKNQVSTITAENENLKIVLANNSNINTIQEYAVNNLNMGKPNVKDAIKIDLNKSNFNAKNDAKASENIIEKIKRAIF